MQHNIKVIGRYSYCKDLCLGHGSFGKVYQGFENTTKAKVAVKKVDFKLFEEDAHQQQALYSEIKIMDRFRHPNIVQLYEVLQSKRSIYIVMEYCGEGDLKKHLKTNGRLSEQEAYEIMKQIAMGFTQLRKNKVVHRDLKPANVLISNGKYKLCDFGFAKYVKNAEQMLKSCVGSPLYMAPQILERAQYTYKCDIWSFGVIYFEILHGSPPWRAANQVDLLKNIKKIPLQLANCFQEDLINFVKSLLVIQEAKRATWEDVFAYFKIDMQKQEGEQIVPIVEPLQQLKPDTIQPHQQAQTLLQFGPSITSPTPSCFSWQPLSPQPTSYPQPICSPMITTSDDAYFGLNCNFFEELAFRSFVCCQLSSNLHVLTPNFSRHLFHKLILLLRASVIYRFQKIRPILEIIADMTAVQLIKRQWAHQQTAFMVFGEEIRGKLEEQEYQGVSQLLQSGIPKDMRIYQGVFRKLAANAVDQLQRRIQYIDDDSQIILFLSILENICDVFIINAQQTRGFSISFEALFEQRSSECDIRAFRAKVLTKIHEFLKQAPTSFFEG